MYTNKAYFENTGKAASDTAFTGTAINNAAGTLSTLAMLTAINFSAFP